MHIFRQDCQYPANGRQRRMVGELPERKPQPATHGEGVQLLLTPIVPNRGCVDLEALRHLLGCQSVSLKVHLRNDIPDRCLR